MSFSNVEAARKKCDNDKIVTYLRKITIQKETKIISITEAS